MPFCSASGAAETPHPALNSLAPGALPIFTFGGAVATPASRSAPDARRSTRNLRGRHHDARFGRPGKPLAPGGGNPPFHLAGRRGWNGRRRSRPRRVQRRVVAPTQRRALCRRLDRRADHVAGRFALGGVKRAGAPPAAPGARRSKSARRMARPTAPTPTTGTSPGPPLHPDVARCGADGNGRHSAGAPHPHREYDLPPLRTAIERERGPWRPHHVTGRVALGARWLRRCRVSTVCSVL